MSLGRSETIPEVTIGKVTQALNTFKRVGVAYFEKPLQYLFYGGLLASLVSFFFGHRPLPEFYIVMLILAGIEFIRINPINSVSETAKTPEKENGND